MNILYKRERRELIKTFFYKKVWLKDDVSIQDIEDSEDFKLIKYLQNKFTFGFDGIKWLNTKFFLWKFVVFNSVVKDKCYKLQKWCPLIPLEED